MYLKYFVLVATISLVTCGRIISEVDFDVDNSNSIVQERSKAKKVKVNLYYEAFCPGCRYYDTHIMVPTYLELADYVDFTPFPYGNAQMEKQPDGSVSITCQHGPGECYGNKLHACALDLVKDFKIALQFNSCMMSKKRTRNGSDNDAAEYCGKKYAVDYKAIETCANSKKGFELLKHYGELSQKVGYDYVPYVTINGKEFNERNNLKKAICELLSSPPPTCSSLFD